MSNVENLELVSRNTIKKNTSASSELHEYAVTNGRRTEKRNAMVRITRDVLIVSFSNVHV